MPTAHECAVAIKATCRDMLSPSPMRTQSNSSPRMWFRPSEEQHTIPLHEITAYNDREYEEWKDLKDDRITHECDDQEELLKFIEKISEENLTSLLSMVPDGVTASETQPAFEFTPYQRLSMCVFVSNPYPRTSKITVGTEELRAIANYSEFDVNKRKIPIQAQYSLLQGECPDVSIIDLPPAAGKTSWALTVAFLLMSPLFFTRLMKSYRRKRLGTVFDGCLTMPVGRVALIGVAGAVFEHFASTLRRLIPNFKKILPNFNFEVWTTMSKHYSVAKTAEMSENTMVFWLVPPSKINEVLRATTDIAVAVGITDEFTIDTPRQRSKTAMSPVIKQMITQATPKMLTMATRGRSWLNEFLGGQLFCDANLLSRQIRSRNFSFAQTIAEQYCKMDLITQSIFRHPIRMDQVSSNLLPVGLQVNFLRARRHTIASHISGALTDIAPVSLAKVLIRKLETDGYRVGSHSSRELERIFSGSIIHADDIIEKLGTFVNEYGESMPKDVIDRLKERLDEFEVQCPICFDDAPPMKDVRLFSCCGYAICKDCTGRCTRCPFCRSAVRDGTIGCLESNVIELSDEENDTDPDYPTRPTTFGSTIEETVARLRSTRPTQIAATVLALHTLIHFGYKRILIMVEHRRTMTTENPISLSTMQRICGIRLFDVDDAIRGKGQRFANMKYEFDADDSIPKAFVCFSSPEFLIGTDLYRTDAILTSGMIPNKMLTQAIGRAIRPNPNRDPTKPLAMITVHV